MKTKYYILDPKSGLSSELYDTYDEAYNDYHNDISFEWSFDAVIISCEVNE